MHSRLYQRRYPIVCTLARRDGLTGIANRRTYDEHVERCTCIVIMDDECGEFFSSPLREQAAAEAAGAAH